MNNNVVEDDGAEATFPMAGFFGGQPNEFDLACRPWLISGI